MSFTPAAGAAQHSSTPAPAHHTLSSSQHAHTVHTAAPHHCEQHTAAAADASDPQPASAAPAAASRKRTRSATRAAATTTTVTAANTRSQAKRAKLAAAGSTVPPTAVTLTLSQPLALSVTIAAAVTLADPLQTEHSTTDADADAALSSLHVTSDDDSEYTVRVGGRRRRGRAQKKPKRQHKAAKPTVAARRGLDAIEEHSPEIEPQPQPAPVAADSEEHKGPEEPIISADEDGMRGVEQQAASAAPAVEAASAAAILEPALLEERKSDLETSVIEAAIAAANNVAPATATDKAGAHNIASEDGLLDAAAASEFVLLPAQPQADSPAPQVEAASVATPKPAQAEDAEMANAPQVAAAAMDDLTGCAAVSAASMSSEVDALTALSSAAAPLSLESFTLSFQAAEVRDGPSHGHPNWSEARISSRALALLRESMAWFVNLPAAGDSSAQALRKYVEDCIKHYGTLDCAELWDLYGPHRCVPQLSWKDRFAMIAADNTAEATAAAAAASAAPAFVTLLSPVDHPLLESMMVLDRQMRCVQAEINALSQLPHAESKKAKVKADPDLTAAESHPAELNGLFGTPSDTVPPHPFAAPTLDLSTPNFVFTPPAELATFWQQPFARAFTAASERAMAQLSFPHDTSVPKREGGF